MAPKLSYNKYLPIKEPFILKNPQWSVGVFTCVKDMSVSKYIHETKVLEQPEIELLEHLISTQYLRLPDTLSVKILCCLIFFHLSWLYF